MAAHYRTEGPMPLPASVERDFLGSYTCQQESSFQPIQLANQYSPVWQPSDRKDFAELSAFRLEVFLKQVVSNANDMLVASDAASYRMSKLWVPWIWLACETLEKFSHPNKFMQKLVGLASFVPSGGMVGTSASGLEIVHKAWVHTCTSFQRLGIRNAWCLAQTLQRSKSEIDAWLQQDSRFGGASAFESHLRVVPGDYLRDYLQEFVLCQYVAPCLEMTLLADMLLLATSTLVEISFSSSVAADAVNSHLCDGSIGAETNHRRPIAGGSTGMLLQSSLPERTRNCERLYVEQSPAETARIRPALQGPAHVGRQNSLQESHHTCQNHYDPCEPNLSQVPPTEESGATHSLSTRLTTALIIFSVIPSIVDVGAVCIVSFLPLLLLVVLLAAGWHQLNRRFDDDVTKAKRLSVEVCSMGAAWFILLLPIDLARVIVCRMLILVWRPIWQISVEPIPNNFEYIFASRPVDSKSYSCLDTFMIAAQISSFVLALEAFVGLEYLWQSMLVAMMTFAWCSVLLVIMCLAIFLTLVDVLMPDMTSSCYHIVKKSIKIVPWSSMLQYGVTLSGSMYHSCRSFLVRSFASKGRTLSQRLRFLRAQSQSQVEHEQRIGECILCRNASISTVLVPCGHMLACGVCSQRLQHGLCPICRSQILVVQPIYLTS